MPASDTTTVLIVGAGPTGLTMASQLARLGVDCRIVEKSPAPAEQSRALGIQARTVEVFNAMGVAEQFVTAGWPVHGLSVYAAKKRIAHIRLESLDTPFPFVLVLPQSQTEKILQSNLQEKLGINVQRRIEWLRMERGGNRIVSFLKDETASERTIESDWLIGCDGAHSAIRHALNLPFEGAEYPETFVLADVHIPAGLDEDEPHIHLTPNGLYGFVPMGRKLFRIIVSVHDDSSYDQPTLEEVQQLIDARSPEPLQLRDPIWLARFHVHRRMSKRVRDGNIFIVGDAAHIHSPAGGQGMNTGIQDAFNLSWKLAAVIKKQSPPSLLDSYEAERLPIAHAVLRGTDIVMKLIALQSPLARYARDHVAPLLFGIGKVREQISNNVAELAVNYRDSNLSEDHPCTTGPVAGDRAPDAQFRGRNLFSFIDGVHWMLLAFDASIALEPTITLLINVHSIARGTEPQLHDKYGVTRPCVYLIRPDGYIAFHAPADQPQLLGNYLSRIFLDA
ncbi:MAG TPA: FAD-dependent monooxygenase [Tepidisphaeraceae bacterium]|nr:FAD-dependent monooxygenase [Tepidisphaeraceae bacterium]